MTLANRAIGAPINIWNDHSDAMAVRDSGWIQLFAETNQEAADLHVQAFRLAEELSLPVMVCMDGFILTHAVEGVDVPDQDDVDAFLPPYEPRQVLDPDDPVSIGAMVGPEAFEEVRYLAHLRQLEALDRIPELAAEFADGLRARRAGGWCAPTGPRTPTRSSSRSARCSAPSRTPSTRGASRASASAWSGSPRSGRSRPTAVRAALAGASGSSSSRRRSSVGFGGVLSTDVAMATHDADVALAHGHRRSRRPPDHPPLARGDARRGGNGPSSRR